jgi:DNA-binding response OmpR family regulator
MRVLLDLGLPGRDGLEVLRELRALVHEHDKQVALLIQRGDSRIFVPVGLG